jgi:MFS family permease
MANFTAEILPYSLRAKGYTWLNFCVTAALFFNQYINGIALDAIHWKYYIVYCVFLVFEVLIIYFFVIETRYTPIEEIAKFFDGKAADVKEAAIANAKEHGLEITDEKSPAEAHVEEA